MLSDLDWFIWDHDQKLQMKDVKSGPCVQTPGCFGQPHHFSFLSLRDGTLCVARTEDSENDSPATLWDTDWDIGRFIQGAHIV